MKKDEILSEFMEEEFKGKVFVCESEICVMTFNAGASPCPFSRPSANLTVMRLAVFELIVLPWRPWGRIQRGH